MISVAICIPTYNQADYLAEAVRSAYNQDYRPSEETTIEVWVSDDASTDQTPQVIATLCHEFPTLKAFRQEQNLGISDHNNWLLSRPKTDYIVRLDSDDFLHPDYVRELVAAMESHPQAGYGHCAINQINESGTPRRVRQLRRSSRYENAEIALRAAAEGYRVAANICIFRREALESVNFLRNAMAFAEDWDLSVRLADAGWGNLYLSEVLASYRVWEDANQERPRRKRDEIKGCIRVFNDGLTPAFERRQWNTAPLQKKRRSLALVHAIVLDSPLFSPMERRELLLLLRVLGSSSRLNLRVRLLRMGCGPLLRWQQRFIVVLRDKIKNVLVEIRRLKGHLTGITRRTR